MIVNANYDDDSDALEPTSLNSECLVPEELWEGDRVRLCNLWGRSCVCRVCEEESQRTEEGNCYSCGVWQGESYTLQQSEAAAAELLVRRNQIERGDLDNLLSKSLTTWKSKTRLCDLQAAEAKGLTLGSYAYGTKVGVTNQTTLRPNLTKLLNLYLKQLQPESTWSALRVTCNFASEPHTDRNQRGSKNLFVPISRFAKGRIWVEGVPGPGEKGETRIVKGVSVVGKWIGGDSQACWFDASRPHAVESSEGDRRVVIGYTPRLLDRMSAENVSFLRQCEFPLPLEHAKTEFRESCPQPFPLPLEHAETESQESCPQPFPLSLGPESLEYQESHRDAFEKGFDESEIDQLFHEHVMLRKFLLEQHKHMQEEVSVAAREGWEALTKPLNDLHQWIEDAEQWLLWQDSEQLLSKGAVSDDERLVLEARLRSLGVSSDSAVHLHGDKDWFGLYDEEDPTQGSGGVGYEKTSDLHVYPGAWEAVPAQPLQTITVSHQEVLRNIDDWKGAISDELGNVFDVHQAMRRRSEAEMQAFKDAGEVVEILPAKALFNRKGGSGRHKCRVVACGNYAEGAKTKSRDRKLQCYAGGADSLSLRCHLRAAGHRAVTNQWRTSGADIRTAFLLAPLRQQSKRIFLRPPSVLKQAGFAAEGEFWEITGALYGLQDSPADWAMYRDETLPTIEIVYRERTTYLTRSKYEPNMWLLYCPFTSELLAALTIYVDDLLLSGTAEASEAIWTAIKGKWKISEPDYADEGHAITFCGFEIEQKTDGIHVGQSKYIQSLLEKYPEIQGTVGCPYAKENDNNDCKPQDSIEKLRKAQAIVGEMLWVATRTRPDLVFGVSRIGQLITRDVDQAIQRGEDMIRYLRATKHQELVYGMPGIGHGPGDQLPVERNFNLIEVFADASFCPGTDRSQTGIILMWGNAPVGWMSMRQPCASLSTAEAELQASLDGMTLAEGLHGLLTELAEAPQQSFLYNDNIGACTVMTLPQGAWRTRHLRLKAAWFLEQLELSRFRIYHVPGKFMLGDLCTKSLQGVRVRELLQMMSVQLGPSNVDGGESHAIKKAATGAEVNIGSGGVISGGAEKALKALTAASLLHGVLSKLVTVQVDIEPEEKNQFDYNNNLLKLACGALLLVALTALATWKCLKHVDPRIRVVRELSETSSDWSHVRSEPASPDGRDEDDDKGSKGCGSRSVASPAPKYPSGSSGSGLRSRVGGRGYAGPAPQLPSGSLTHDDSECQDEEGMVVSDTVGKGSRSLTSPVPQRPSGSSDDDTLRRRSLAGERLLGGVLDAFSASGDAGLSEGDDDLPPGDEQEDTAAEPQSALEPKAAARLIPVIYPAWHLRTPPQETWDPEPAWGGPESNFHQSIPPRVKKDFWHVDRRRGVAVRFHAQPRVKLYLPGPSGLPEGVQYAQLTGRRRTLAKFSEPVDFKIVSDEWNTADRPTRQLERRWTGRTEFELQGLRAE